jgi:fructose-bisphosphate aldolase class I
MSARIEVLVSQLPAYNKPEIKYRDELLATTKAMTTRGKGLLAADESMGTVGKRFSGIKLENNLENRRKYRALMVGADGLNQYISGIIFHEETLTQKMDDGSTFPAYCTKIGIVPGIKTDLGLAPLYEGAPGEEQTLGLDGYVKRAQKFYAQGARFCKWRNTYKIQNGTVSEAAVFHNAHTLARYALLSQMAGLVPIVEPEVMIDGTHTIEQCQAVSQRVWSAVGAALQQHGVMLDCMVLKPNMVVPGAESGQKATPAQVALATTITLARSFPAIIPGVTFLSGGLSEVEASEFLNAMNVAGLPVPRPWTLTFSYARALQSSALKAWAGVDAGFPAGRAALLHRAKQNSLAQLGKYDRAADDKTSESLFVKGYKY